MGIIHAVIFLTYRQFHKKLLLISSQIHVFIMHGCKYNDFSKLIKIGINLRNMRWWSKINFTFRIIGPVLFFGCIIFEPKTA